MYVSRTVCHTAACSDPDSSASLSVLFSDCSYVVSATARRHHHDTHILELGVVVDILYLLSLAALSQLSSVAMLAWPEPHL